MIEYEAACQRFARCAIGDELGRKHARNAIKAAETKMRKAFGASIEERDRIMYDISIKACRPAA
jgi:hypothetical protein